MTDGNEPTDQPEGNAPDLSALITELNAGFDKRFQGFQSLLDKRTAEFQCELVSLRTADLTPEQREEDQSRKATERIARLERENELLNMRKQFPEEVDLLTDFFKKSSLQEQLDLLAAFRKAEAEGATPTEGPDDQPTPVDKNNPARKPTTSLAEMAGNMTKELADRVLSQSDEPGMLRRLREG